MRATAGIGDPVAQTVRPYSRSVPRALPRRLLAPVLALAVLAGCAATDDALVHATRRAPRTTTTDAPAADAGPPSSAADSPPATTADSTPATTADSAPTTADSAPGTTEEGDPATTAPDQDPPVAIDWAPCTGASGPECGRLEVPLDYADPRSGTITLQLQRTRAKDPSQRIGSLLVNPGGPGVSTLDEGFVSLLPLVLDDAIVDRFDLVGWDPRGVGRSDHVDCVDDLDQFLGALDPTPDTPAERAAYDDATSQFTAACQRSSGRLLAHVSTQDTARDMDRIAAALGEDAITYFGFSYGSALGATFATMFPERVRAIVIDGAANPTADYVAAAREGAVGIERALTAVLDDCSQKPTCAFYSDGQAAAAFDALFARLDGDPLPAPPGRPPIGQGIMAWATISSLYDRTQWNDLTQALADARNGDGNGLLELYDRYWDRSADGTWTNAYEALIAINCVDQPRAPTADEIAKLAVEVSGLAPRTGSWFIEQNLCADWPAHAPRLDITGAGAGPILVLGNTGDPVTPIESTEAMARALDEGRLITYKGTGHTAYVEARLARNRCVVDAVTRYLVDGKAPTADLSC